MFSVAPGWLNGTEAVSSSESPDQAKAMAKEALFILRHKSVDQSYSRVISLPFFLCEKHNFQGNEQPIDDSHVNAEKWIDDDHINMEKLMVCLD